MDSTELYVNADAIRSALGKKIEESNTIFTSPSPQLTVRDPVRMRSYRSVTVCLVLLCVLLLTAVIVLCVLIITNNHQFHIKSKNITEERDQLLTKYSNITKERDKLTVKYNNISKLSEQLNREKNELQTNLRDGWIYCQFNLYFISSENKNWSESRRYCRERGADLIIIDNKEEQDFVSKISCKEKIWIGLSDSNSSRWKWVDNSTLTTIFWDTSEPNGQKGENCAVTYSSRWADFPCNTSTFKWICEKNIFK